MTKSDAAGEHQAGRKKNISPEPQAGIGNTKIHTTSSGHITLPQGKYATGKSQTFNEALRKKIDSGQGDMKPEKKDPSENPQKRENQKKADLSEKTVLQSDWVIRQNEPSKTVDKVSENGVVFEKAPGDPPKTRKSKKGPSMVLEKNRHIKTQEAVEPVHKNGSDVNSETIGNPGEVAIPQKSQTSGFVQVTKRPDNNGLQVPKTTYLEKNTDTLARPQNESGNVKNSEKTDVSEDLKPDTATVHKQPLEKSARSGSNPLPVKEISISDQAASRSGADNAVSTEVMAAISKPAMKQTSENEPIIKPALEVPVKDRSQHESKSQVSLDNDVTSKPSAPSSVYKNNVQAEQMKGITHVDAQKPISGDNTFPEVSTEVSTSSNSVLSVDIAETINSQPESAAIEVKGNSGLGMARQIEDSISTFYRPGAKQIVIRLDPPELGQLTIKFIEHRDGDITAILHADKSQTKDQIQQALPSIVQNLQNSGVQIKKFDVQLNYQQSNASDQHNHGQNHPFEDPAQDTPTLSDNSGNEHLPESLETSSGVAQRDVQTSSDSINVLI